MVKCISLFFIFASNFIYGTSLETFHPIIRDIKDLEGAEQHPPRHFRITTDDINQTEEQAALRLEGLKDLKVIGSAQFTEKQLREILKKWDTKVMIVDLREETHLLLETIEGNQIPISAFVAANLGNAGKSIEEIEYEHLRYRQFILEQGVISLPYGKGNGIELESDVPIFAVNNIFTEKEVVERASGDHPGGVEYVYLPMTDHQCPTPETVDQLLRVAEAMKNNPELILFFHCRAGRGRTGTMMAMLDILKNSKKHQLSLHEILKRQAALGSPDFAAVDRDKPEQSLDRLNFFEQFYNFAIDENGFETETSFTAWLKDKSALQLF